MWSAYVADSKRQKEPHCDHVLLTFTFWTNQYRFTSITHWWRNRSWLQGVHLDQGSKDEYSLQRSQTLAHRNPTSQSISGWGKVKRRLNSQGNENRNRLASSVLQSPQFSRIFQYAFVRTLQTSWQWLDYLNSEVENIPTDSILLNIYIKNQLITTYFVSTPQDCWSATF